MHHFRNPHANTRADLFRETTRSKNTFQILPLNPCQDTKRKKGVPCPSLPLCWLQHVRQSGTVFSRISTPNSLIAQPHECWTEGMWQNTRLGFLPCLATLTCVGPSENISRDTCSLVSNQDL